MTSRHDHERRPAGDRDPSGFEAFQRPVAPLTPPPGTFDDIRSRARTRRRNRVLWTGVGLAGCLAGGAVAFQATQGSAPSTVAVSSDDTPGRSNTGSATGQEKSAPGSSAPGSGAGSGDSGPAAGPAACRTADLKVTLGPGEGAAGSQYRPLRISNEGGAACHLFGFPGVSFVDGAGHQVGKPADRNGPQASGKVTLKPGQREQVTLRILNAQNYGPECGLTDAAGIRVYPPGEKHSVVVPVTGITGCASDAIETLTVTSYGVH